MHKHSTQQCTARLPLPVPLDILASTTTRQAVVATPSTTVPDSQLQEIILDVDASQPASQQENLELQAEVHQRGKKKVAAPIAAAAGKRKKEDSCSCSRASCSLRHNRDKVDCHSPKELDTARNDAVDEWRQQSLARLVWPRLSYGCQGEVFGKEVRRELATRSLSSGCTDGFTGKSNFSKVWEAVLRQVPQPYL
ncbi:hypothetical protein ABBQ32_011191 [Trebouxia sp. C0010 RCD-2024]